MNFLEIILRDIISENDTYSMEVFWRNSEKSPKEYLEETLKIKKSPEDSRKELCQMSETNPCRYTSRSYPRSRGTSGEICAKITTISVQISAMVA